MTVLYYLLLRLIDLKNVGHLDNLSEACIQHRETYRWWQRSTAIVQTLNCKCLRGFNPESKRDAGTMTVKIQTKFVFANKSR